MSVFKKIMNQYYTEKLAEHGYVKVKGRYPYWAKMVGDEIVLIIAYASEMPDGTKPLEAFSLWGTVATVYRPKIDFDHSPKSQRDYMVDARRLYGNRVGDAYTGEEGKKRHIFQCFGNNEKSVTKIAERSYKVCEEEIVTRLDEINNLTDVKEFYDTFLPRMLNIYCLRDMDTYHDHTYCEALLLLLLYNSDEFEQIRWKKYYEYERWYIEKKEKRSIDNNGCVDHLDERKKRVVRNINIFNDKKKILNIIVNNNKEKNYLILKEKGVIK